MCLGKCMPVDSSKRTLVLVVIMVLYVVAGAGIFYVLEAPKEQSMRHHLRNIREEFMKANLCIPGL